MIKVNKRQDSYFCLLKYFPICNLFDRIKIIYKKERKKLLGNEFLSFSASKSVFLLIKGL